ncbi:MAG: bifunctional (p)ppGpp synthetase/guanosine-3',5'-bis(diphosphate) 3'-pyrophosphohydrolase [Alistipes sp.]|nr:bifunctional (p)ppGpp synthetase/guanosine-3',5'-bis(diphosphate) 3'-pyrophosphohydrolase [Alistipes sp.]
MNEIYTKQIEESIDSLFSYLKGHTCEEQMERIIRGYEFAAEAHKKQKRRSGEPYIIHPIAVATILARELEMCDNTLIAAFLHDVVEDTPHTIEEIGEHFGDDVAKLVDAVTKRKKKNYQYSKQVDNYRQILESVHFDVRALLIKLADRLHNMRTLDSMSADKQMKIAGETDYFYAPLANRLGLYHIKTELENLSFRYRCPSDYARVEEQLCEEREEDRPKIEKFIDKIDSILKAAGYDVRTEVRYRRPYSVWRKMKATNTDLYHIDGKHYIRIIYSSQPNISDKKMCLNIYSALTDILKEKPCSVCNYIDSPKENGYQSFHVKLLNEHGEWEEIHISSETMVRNSRLGCAAERKETSLTIWLDKFREILKKIATNDNQDMAFMEGVTSTFYNDDIMVFTPKGHGIILPKGATALDFAFEIHSQVGEKAVYARINRKLMSLRTVLQRGDRVEIGTAEDAKPDTEWLDHVSTFKAKHFLRSYFASQPQLPYTRCPLCHPLPEDEVIGYNDGDGKTVLHKRDCPEVIRLASENGDAIVSATFAEDPNFLYPVKIRVQGIDRYHLMSDLIDCITDQLHLTMSSLKTENIDRIAICTIDFAVHSVSELNMVMNSILHIDGIDEVTHLNV